MNRNLKFAIAAAIASLGVTGQAHALTASTATTSGSMFLFAFEDRVGPGSNPAATNSAIFDLGLASTFNTASNQIFDFSASNAWTSYVATIANPANIHWGVFGVAKGTGGTGTEMLTTLSMVPATVNGQVLNSVTPNSNTVMAVYSAADGFSAVQTNDLASGKWDDNGGYTWPGVTTASGLDNSLDFYKYTSIGTKGTQYAIRTNYTYLDAGVTKEANFMLSSNGVLTYTAAAPVPEADSYALMLAGLGLVGYMVRRRKAA